ncbi:MAG: hypothetical protein FWE15_20080 [Actinomycetia bacterium]|nr:hypothetical protein [Actinomycetes bacterium]
MTEQQEMHGTDHEAREAWLERAIDMMRPRFTEVGMPLPDHIHVSVGFGYGIRAESKYILGQTWARRASADGVNHVFIGPQVGDPAEMLVTLLHELIHVADDCQSGHKGAFAEAATRLGFDGPMTQTPPTVGLAAELAVMAAELGPFDHGKLDVDLAAAPVPAPGGGTAPAPAGGGTKVHSGPSKQGTRMIKLVAPDCGYTVRTTRKWLAEGVPSCPHGVQMDVAA